MPRTRAKSLSKKPTPKISVAMLSCTIDDSSFDAPRHFEASGSMVDIGPKFRKFLDEAIRDLRKTK